MMNNYHIPALLNQTVDGIDVKPDGTYIDATFGGGGHSKLILSKLSTGKLIAFDQDTDAFENAFENENFMLIHSNFEFIKNFLDYLKIAGVDGVIADLGLSTHHIDVPERGFSFRFDAPLDMRMNKNQKFDAKTLINNYKETQLTEIFRSYSDLKNAHRIAAEISKSRRKNEINSTFDLCKVIEKFVPKKNEHKFFAQVFQAIRIEVNDELRTLKKFLTQLPDILLEDGKVAVISYHSIEDKLVKNFFKTGNFKGQRITDMYGNLIRPLEPINNKVIVPTDEEIKENNRVRSAKLRIAKKIKTKR